MKTVKFHRYARLERTPIFSEPDGPVRAYVGRRSWLGIVAEKEDWLQVISAQADGWVKKEHCYTSMHFSLSAVLPKAPGQPVVNYTLTG